ncbi:hypothetical protein O9992_16175 [Vibrio lentus]|nr:hypothetical protein [Vibrio lentus]
MLAVLAMYKAWSTLSRTAEEQTAVTKEIAADITAISASQSNRNWRLAKFRKYVGLERQGC